MLERTDTRIKALDGEVFFCFVVFNFHPKYNYAYYSYIIFILINF